VRTRLLIVLTWLLIAGSGSHAFAQMTQLVRRDHPRMLLNTSSLELAKERSKTTHSDIYTKLKAFISPKLTEPVEGSWQPAYTARLMAFISLIEDDEAYAHRGIELLKGSVAAHRDTVRNGLSPANWLAVRYRRANSVAYDWLFNRMTETERMEIGRVLLETADIHAERDKWNHAYAGGYNRYENDFYSGMALYASGVDDPKAKAYLESGFDFLLNETVAARNKVASDDGGIQAGMGYALYNYIPVEANFFSIWESATRLQLHYGDYSLRHFPVWALYSMMPGYQAPPIGDIGGGNRGPITAETAQPLNVSKNSLRLHLARIASFYDDGAAQYLMPEPDDSYVWTADTDILWRDPNMRSVQPSALMPKGRHFDGMGWVVSRTGWKDDATVGIFVAGDQYYGHNHWDEGSFVIYHKGYLAADARGRVYQTAGHNTLLVYDGDDGGQRKSNSDGMVRFRPEVTEECERGDITAFETSKDFVYAAADVTAAYGEKVESFVRHYVHLMPGTFVIFDRVVSKNPQARKVWQLHSWKEPEMTGKTGVITMGDGKLVTRTLLPKRPKVATEFQELVGAEQTKSNLWRITVESEKPEKTEYFLHVLRAEDLHAESEADRGAGPIGFAATLLEDKEYIGAEVIADGKTYVVYFKRSGEPGGRISIRERGELKVDQVLRETVMLQEGYAIKIVN
jgi:hypothetical protein